MKKNGFTLLELLIGVALVSVVIVFLFRLINDIQHEGLSNIYIVLNQTNRDEIISTVTSAISENEKTCSVEEVREPGKTSLHLNFCNNQKLVLSVAKNQIHITYKSKEYNYRMKDDEAYYDTNVSMSKFSMNETYFLKINIKTTKKGLKATMIDDIEIIGKNDQPIGTTTRAVNSADISEGNHTFTAFSAGEYKIEVWAAGKYNPIGPYEGGTYVSGLIQLNVGDRLIIYAAPTPVVDTCSSQNVKCIVPKPGYVSYGVDTRWNTRFVENEIWCNDETFGDPARGVEKSCQYTYYDNTKVAFTNSVNIIPDISEITPVIDADYDSAVIDTTILSNPEVTCYGCTPSSEGDPVLITQTTCQSSNYQSQCTNLSSGLVRITKIS